MSSGENGQTDGVGRVLAGRYRVVEQLGRGGMGVVWRAVDEVLGREVAVKELRTYTDADGPELADLRLRMQREARAAARVRHPGVVAVHDVTELDGRPLIVMELVDGPSLDDVLRERGILDPREAARIGAKVMDALAAAHRVGVLHRDVKPGNILLERSGRVVLTDFGIATMEDPGDGSATHLTRSGELVGSLDYLAPERAQGAATPAPPPTSGPSAPRCTRRSRAPRPFRRTSTWSTLTAIVVRAAARSPQRAGPLGPVLQRLMDKRPGEPPGRGPRRGNCSRRWPRRGRATDTPTTTLRRCGGRDGRREAARRRRRAERGAPTASAGIRARGGRGTGHVTAPRPRGASAGPARAAAPRTRNPRAHRPPGHPATPPRRKGRAVLAAAAVAVVLAAAGRHRRLLAGGDDRGDAEAGTRPTGSTQRTASATGQAAGAGEPPTPRGQANRATTRRPPTADRTAPSGRRDGHRAPVPAEGHQRRPRPDHRRRLRRLGSTPGGPRAGARPQGDPGHRSATSIGGGKYNCTVWRTAKSYTASGTEVGVLNTGTNYFYCQQNLGRRETSGEWTNVWWAKTDDDSGNTDVWVSDVYIQGGANDEPVPGLPVC